MRATISGIHYCIPSQVLGNEELSIRFGEKQLQSITKMAGILERRITSAGITALDLAHCGCERLLSSMDLDRSEIDMLVFATQTPDHQIPANACILHGRLGLGKQCGAMDINLGCSSFPYAAATAASLLVTLGLRRAIVVCADTVTSLVHPLDRSLATLHGDGAAIAIIEPCRESEGLLWFELGSDGTHFDKIVVPVSGTRASRTADTRKPHIDEGITRTDEHLKMDGPAVFHFSLHQVPDAIKAALQKHEMTMNDFDLVLLHQANKTMVDLIYKSCGVPPEKRFYYLEKVGNTAGASTPMLLAEAWRQGRIKPGHRTLTASFGNGLSWGVMAIKWPDTPPNLPTGSPDFVPMQTCNPECES